MKTPHRVCRLLLGGAALGGLLIASASAQDSQIHGTWNCTLKAEDAASGASLNAEFEQTYGADGTYERAGRMNVVIAALQVDLRIALKESGTWRWVDSMVLGETHSAIEFSSAKEAPSQMEQMLLQQMQASSDVAGEEEIVQLTTLTATTMSYEDDEGVTAQCERA